MFWLAQYADGKQLSEREGVSFSLVDRSKLISFGLEGNGFRNYFDMAGTFWVQGQRFEVGRDGHRFTPGEILQYKHSAFALGAGSRIIQHNIGFSCNDAKVLLCVPTTGNPAYLKAETADESSFFVARNGVTLSQVRVNCMKWELKR